jgi:hypothetical protein
MMTDVVWIKTFPDAGTAGAARERLAARGVESVVADPGFRVGVHADDVKAALAVLWDPIPSPKRT